MSKSKCAKTHRSTFGSSDVEKVNAGVARSIFRSLHVQITQFSEHFLKLGYGGGKAGDSVLMLLKGSRFVKLS